MYVSDVPYWLIILSIIRHFILATQQRQSLKAIQDFALKIIRNETELLHSYAINCGILKRSYS